jgi:hypothetical protein
VLLVLRPARKSKEPLPYGSGSSGHGPVKSPVHAVENASLGASSRDISCPKATCGVTRDANRPLWPWIHRWLRSHFASLYRMNAKYMDIGVMCEGPNTDCHCLCERDKPRGSKSVSTTGRVPQRAQIMAR